MAFELKNAPIEPVAAGDLRVTVKPGPDPQNPVEGGQMVFTPEPDTTPEKSLYQQIIESEKVRQAWAPCINFDSPLIKGKSLSSSGDNYQLTDSVVDAEDGVLMLPYGSYYSGSYSYEFATTLVAGRIKLSSISICYFSGGSYSKGVSVYSESGAGAIGFESTVDNKIYAVVFTGNGSSRWSEQGDISGVTEGWHVVYSDADVDFNSGQTTVRVFVDGIKITENISLEGNSELKSSTKTQIIKSAGGVRPAMVLRFSDLLTPDEQVWWLDKFKAEHNIS